MYIYIYTLQNHASQTLPWNILPSPNVAKTYKLFYKTMLQRRSRETSSIDKPSANLTQSVSICFYIYIIYYMSTFLINNGIFMTIAYYFVFNLHVSSVNIVHFTIGNWDAAVLHHFNDKCVDPKFRIIIMIIKADIIRHIQCYLNYYMYYILRYFVLRHHILCIAALLLLHRIAFIKNKTGQNDINLLRTVNPLLLCKCMHI